MMIQHLNLFEENPPRVICLGSRGFIARRFIEKLQNKGVDYLALGASEVDLTKPESVDFLKDVIRPDDTVVMFSALTPDRGKDLKTYYANMKMAEYVALSLEKTFPGHFIYISTDAVYASVESKISEMSPCDPGDLYGLMHLSREKILGYVMDQIKKPMAVLRPCAIYGVGDTHQSYGPNRFIKSALQEGKISLFGAGEEIRDHVWIEDVVEWIWGIAARKSTGIVNLVSGRGLSFMKVAQLISEKYDRKIEVLTSNRKNPISHREFNDQEIRRAFPERPSSNFEEVIKTIIQSLNINEV